MTGSVQTLGAMAMLATIGRVMKAGQGDDNR